MKWYLHKHHQIHLADIRVLRGDTIEVYYPYVIQIANTFPKGEVAIGALNLQDLVQAGHAGLIDAWALVDHTRPQPEKWAYIKKRIKWAIRREIDNCGAFIKVPRRDIEEQRMKLSGIDKTLVTIFPSFFDRKIITQTYDIRPWEIERLGELIDDYLYSNIQNIDHVEILRALFGIDRNQKASIKELAIKYKKSEIGIKKIRERLLKKLNNEDFKNIIKNFYEN